MNWIKTKDKLPELNKTVLCYKDDDIIIGCLIMDEISEDKKILKWFNDDFMTLGRVDYFSHWMELPEKPTL
jgi:hypothetical protein